MLDEVSKLRNRAELQSLNAVGWYYDKKKAKNFGSRWLRFWAITLTVFGGLIPLLSSAGIVQALLWYFAKETPNVQLVELRFNQFGYVLIGLAAGCVSDQSLAAQQGDESSV